MDKVTRMLFLYSKLIQGEKINKTSFCMETDSLPRTFDRDIEDIRLYLSEFYYGNELFYDKLENVYYFTNPLKKSLECMEYLFLERILLDTRILRVDEMKGLLSHLAENTNKTSNMLLHKNRSIQQYEEPIHQKAILKMHKDLIEIMEAKFVIKINYTKINGVMVERELLPCMIKYDLGHLYLIAFFRNDYLYPAYFRLDRIYSFSIIRKQEKDEIEKVTNYLQKHARGMIQMYGGNFVQILLSCKKEYFQYVYDTFQQIHIVREDKTTNIQVQLYVFEDGFIKWIMSQPTDLVQVLEPENIKEKIVQEANKLLTTYTGGCNYGKKT